MLSPLRGIRSTAACRRIWLSSATLPEDWAHPCHVYTGTGAPLTQRCLGSPPPHRHGDWLHGRRPTVQTHIHSVQQTIPTTRRSRQRASHKAQQMTCNALCASGWRARAFDKSSSLRYRRWSHFDGRFKPCNMLRTTCHRNGQHAELTTQRATDNIQPPATGHMR
jgi:hypothetical protein